MKTCKTGCGKMKTGGTIKKIKKMATGGQALNKAKGYAPAQKGGDNVSKQIYGIPNAGTTGPNRTAGYQYKKGGSAKSKGCPPGYYWSVQGCQEKTPGYKKPFSSTGSKVGIGTAVAGVVGTAVKAVSDKIKARKAEKEKTKKEGETPKAKFGASVPVKSSCKKGMVRGADGNCVMERPKFQKGGSTYLGGPSDLKTPGTMMMRADKDARSKYFTPDNIRKEGIKLSDKEIEKKVKIAKDSLYNKYMKDAKLTPEKKSTTKKTTAKKMAKGGFPDLTGDNKVTKADILKGRGVIKKKGGETKDKNWIQKAVNPAHKGYCTPETKKTCTPRRKALAHTLRKMAKNR